MMQQSATIDLRLFATLSSFAPANAACFPIEPGITVGQLLEQIPLSPAEAKLIFINGIKGHSGTKLHGGERVGIFPPVGGG